MTDPSREQLELWIAQWRSASVALAKVNAEEVRAANLAQIAEALDDVSIVAARARGVSTTSGLIVQQRLFKGARPP